MLCYVMLCYVMLCMYVCMYIYVYIYIHTNNTVCNLYHHYIHLGISIVSLPGNQAALPTFGRISPWFRLKGWPERLKPAGDTAFFVLQCSTALLVDDCSDLNIIGKGFMGCNHQTYGIIWIYIYIYLHNYVYIYNW